MLVRNHPTPSPIAGRIHPRLRAVFLLVLACAVLVGELRIPVAGAEDSASEIETYSDDALLTVPITASNVRQVAIEMLDSVSTDLVEAAAEVLISDLEEGSVEALSEAQRLARHDLLTTISSVSGAEVQQRIGELLESDDPQEFAAFLEGEWQTLQTNDDRAFAWQAAHARDGSSVKIAADRVLAENTPEAFAEFAATGYDQAKGSDDRRAVYQLTRSPLPTVAAGAAEAITVNTDTAIEGFLRYGQYVAASQDTTTQTLSEAVSMAIEQANAAREATSMAVQNADRAARAADNAYRATERARKEAIEADRARLKAGQAADAAGQLATRAAREADRAVAAANEARAGLQRTADALSRAVAAAAQARRAAAVAAARASDASRDAFSAQAARLAAEEARDAADAARRSIEAFGFANEAAGFVSTAGRAAANAAFNADAAAAAAEEASGAAGISGQAAEEARAGARRARAAANRARDAAGRVDGIVTEISDLVEQAKTAARDSAEHAQRSAGAAEEAAREAGNAEYAARVSGQFAADATEAARAANDVMGLAERTAEVAAAVARERAESERAFLRAEAEDARTIQDKEAREEAEAQATRKKLRAQIDRLGSGEEITDLGELRRIAVAAVRVGRPALAGAARTALQGGTAEDLRVFADEGFEDAAYTDDLAVVTNWAAAYPDENVRQAALSATYYDADQLREFIATGAEAAMVWPLLQAAYELRDSAGSAVQAAADEAIAARTYESLDAFINGGGYDDALWEDQIGVAYELTSTGGPEVKAAAEAAVLGDREGLYEFATVERYRRQALDSQREAYGAQVQSLLRLGREATDQANEVAALANEAHEAALGSAEEARGYADAAARFAGQAAESSRIAGDHVRHAQEALDFARGQQQRAHEAAAQADRDAQRAEIHADQAESAAVDARVAAYEAAGSAVAARNSAIAAEADAVGAARAASDAYAVAWQKKLAEDAELLYVLSAEETTDEAAVPPSLKAVIRDVIGPEMLDLVLEVVGYKDIERCLKGSVSGCIWAAAGLVPVGKLAKLAKVIPAVKRLVARSGDILAVFSGRKGRIAQAIRRVTTPPGCVPGGMNLAESQPAPVWFGCGGRRGDRGVAVAGRMVVRRSEMSDT